MGMVFFSSIHATNPSQYQFTKELVNFFLENIQNLAIFIDQHEDFNVDAEDNDGRTLLIAAIEDDKFETAQFLVKELSADVNKGIDCADQPPLHCAIWNHRYNIVELLLENGAEMNKEDEDGTLPLMTAAQGGALINNLDDGSVTHEDLHAHEDLKKQVTICKNIITLLVNKGADINAQSSRTGETALHCAVAWKLKELVKTLCDLGADVTIRSDEGKTPLHYAQERLNVDDQTEKEIQLLKEILVILQSKNSQP